MVDLILILIFLLVAALLIYFGYYLVSHRIRERLAEKAGAQWYGKVVLRKDGWVKFYGQETVGPTQFQSNGALVLTADLLWFMLAFPKGEISIPLRTVRQVQIKNSYLGKIKKTPILIVSFQDGEMTDRIGLGVAEPESWRDAIVKTAVEKGAVIQKEED